VVSTQAVQFHKFTNGVDVAFTPKVSRLIPTNTSLESILANHEGALHRRWFYLETYLFREATTTVFVPTIATLVFLFALVDLGEKPSRLPLPQRSPTQGRCGVLPQSQSQPVVF
jgi:hypothetical protein